MFPRVLLQKPVVLEVLQNRAVLGDLILIIVLLRLQLVDLLLETLCLDQVVLVEYRYHQYEHGDRNQPQAPVLEEFSENHPSQRFLQK